MTRSVSHCLANVVSSSGLTVFVHSNFCWLLNVICCLTWVFGLTECSATGGKSEVLKITEAGKLEKWCQFIFTVVFYPFKADEYPSYKTLWYWVVWKKMKATLWKLKGISCSKPGKVLQGSVVERTSDSGWWFTSCALRPWAHLTTMSNFWESIVRRRNFFASVRNY